MFPKRVGSKSRAGLVLRRYGLSDQLHAVQPLLRLLKYCPRCSAAGSPADRRSPAGATTLGGEPAAGHVLWPPPARGAAANRALQGSTVGRDTCKKRLLRPWAPP